MVERTLIMSFKDEADRKVNVTVRDLKETVDDADVSAVMNDIVENGLLETSAGAVEKIMEANIITKEVEKVTLG